MVLKKIVKFYQLLEVKILTDQIKILSILGPRFKFGYYALVIFNFIIGFLEALSIAAIIPLVGMLLQNGKKNFYFNFEKIFVFQDNQLITLSIIFIIFFLKNIIIGIYSFAQVKYSFKAQYKIGNILFENFISKKYIDIKKINISQILRVINTDATLVVTGYILPGLQIITELIIILSYLSFVIFFQPKGIVVFTIIFLCGLLIYQFFKKKLNYLGTKRLSFEKKKIQTVNESFKLFKELKVFLKEKVFINNFNVANKDYNYVIAGLHYIQILPRIFIETLGILSILIFVYFLLITGEENSNIVTTLAIYVAVMARSLPSINRVATALQSLKFNSKTLDELTILLNEKNNYNDLKKNENFQVVKNSLQVESLDFSFFDGKNEKKILKNLNFKVKKGELLLIRGRSGSGKTTLSNILLGLLEPTGGKILIDENPNIKNFLVSYVPQDVFLMDDTIEYNITFTKDKKLIDHSRLKNAICLSELNYEIKFLKNGVDSITGDNGSNISGGQRQRIGIARALYQNSNIIVLDEPTSNLDEENEQKIFENIKNLSKDRIVILISHSEKSLNLTNNILTL